MMFHELREKLKKENEKRLNGLGGARNGQEPIEQNPEFRSIPLRIVLPPAPPTPIDDDVD